MRHNALLGVDVALVEDIPLLVGLGGHKGCIYVPTVPTFAVRETASLGQQMSERWEKM